MRQCYPLYWLILSFLSLSAEAQSFIQHRVTAGLLNATLQLETEYETEVLFASGRSYSKISSNSLSDGLGLGIGYQALLHPRWELAIRANYMGNTVEGELDAFDSRSLLSPEQVDELRHPRKYRGLWLEGLVFWRVVGPYSLMDIQVGTGITYAHFQHSYLRGYVLDADRNIFAVKTFAKERKSSWGVPLHFQLQYPINSAVKIGLNAYVNPYFIGDAVTGIMAFGAYWW